MLFRRTSFTTLAALLLDLGPAASLGKASHEITAFDYPGTARTSRADALIRVLLQGNTRASTLVWENVGWASWVQVTLSCRVG